MQFPQQPSLPHTQGLADSAIDAAWAVMPPDIVEWDHDELIVRRRPAAEMGAQWPSGLGRRERYPVTSVREAVDILVVLAVLPARFSSAYRAALTQDGGQ